MRHLPWLLLPAALLVACTLSAQIPTGVIGGEIHIAGGDLPSHQIMVELRFREATIYTAYTDSQGRFSFSSLAPNPYHVVIIEEGFYPVDEVAIIRPESPSTMIQLTLRPREPQRKDDPLGTRAQGGSPYLVDPADYNKRFPKKAIKEYEHGVDAERKGRRDDAIAHYQVALKIAPDYYPARNNLGTLYLGNSDFKSAEVQFREVIRLDQNDAQAYFNLGNVLMLTGRYSDSENALASGLQRQPKSAFGYFLQGCLYARTSRFDQAETSLHQAMDIDPAMWQAQLQISNLYVQQNRREAAIAQLQAFLKSFPSSPAIPRVREVLQKLQAEQSTRRAPQ